MTTEACVAKETKGLGVFERYLTVWVLLCIGVGIVLGKLAPGVAMYLDSLAISVNGAPVVSIPIAVCLFFMMFPIMVKIDFAEVVKAGRSVKPVGLTLFVNWAIKPFTMYAIAVFFLGTLFLGFIGPDAVDHVKMPLGRDMSVGEAYGAGKVVLVDGVKMLQVPLWRSYLAGCILLGIAPFPGLLGQSPGQTQTPPPAASQTQGPPQNPQAAAAPARCWRCARARCRSSWSTARSSAG